MPNDLYDPCLVHAPPHLCPHLLPYLCLVGVSVRVSMSLEVMVFVSCAECLHRVLCSTGAAGPPPPPRPPGVRRTEAGFCHFGDGAWRHSLGRLCRSPSHKALLSISGWSG